MLHVQGHEQKRVRLGSDLRTTQGERRRREGKEAEVAEARRSACSKLELRLEGWRAAIPEPFPWRQGCSGEQEADCAAVARHCGAQGEEGGKGGGQADGQCGLPPLSKPFLPYCLLPESQRQAMGREAEALQ